MSTTMDSRSLREEIKEIQVYLREKGEYRKANILDFVQFGNDKGPKKKNVIFDFDGVINSYKSGWCGVTNIPDPPVPGIKEAIAEIRTEYRVVVVSSRCYQEGGIAAIKDYLEKYGIAVDEVTGEKPPAVVAVDDRAICFSGDVSNLAEEIKNFKSWTEK